MLKSESYKKLLKSFLSALSRDNLSHAQGILDKIKRQYPAKGWYHQGLAYPILRKAEVLNKKILQKQIKYFRKSLNYDSQNPAAWRALGNALFMLKKYNLAEKAYFKSLNHSKSQLAKNDALRFLADVAIQRGNLKKAKRLLDRVLHSKYRPPFIQLAPHFINYYKKIDNRKLTNYWVKKGIASAKIIQKSGKKPYGSRNTYKEIIKYFREQIIIS